MYPIFSDAGLLFFALKYTNSDHLEITQAMVTELASQVDSTKSIAIIYDAIACYIYESNHNELISLKTFSTEIQETIQGRGILNSSFNIKDSLETSSLSPVKMLPYTENTIQARAISNIVLSVPVVKQTPYNNLCWAACVTCVGNYVTGRNYTIETIAKSMYDDSNFDQTATEVTTRLALDYNYGISYLNSTTSTPPSETLIYNNLSQGYPVLGYCRSIQYSLYHMVVIRGVNPSISRIYLMVPEYGYVISNKTSGVYSYTSPYSGIPLELYGYGSKL